MYPQGDIDQELVHRSLGCMRVIVKSFPVTRTTFLPTPYYKAKGTPPDRGTLREKAGVCKQFHIYIYMRVDQYDLNHS